MLLVAVVLTLGTIEVNGDPIINNPDALIIQVVVTAGVVGAAVLPLLVKTQRDAEVAREQVANDHVDEAGKPINLRVEQDERHYEVLEKLEDFFDHVNKQFDGVRSDMRGIRRDVGRNTDGLDKTRDKLDEHIDQSREIIGEFKTEIETIHSLIKKEDEA